MATVVDTRSSYNGGFRLRIRLERVEVDVAGNRSRVKSRVWLESLPNNNGWYWFSNISSKHGQSIDGIQVYDGWINRSISTGGSTLILDNERWVTHNSAGSRTVASAATFSNIYTPNLYHAVSLTLDKITQPTPAVPKISGVTRSGTTITVKWGSVANSDGYTLQHRVNGGSWSTVQVAGTSYNRTGAVAGSKYDFRVLAKAVGNGSNSAYSAVASYSWVPNAPSALKVTRVSDTQHSLVWTRGSTYTSVVVQRADNGGAWRTVASPSGNLSAYTDTTTKANSRYVYRVQGVAPGGSSGVSNEVTVFTTPAAPSGVTAVRLAGDDISVNGSVPVFASHVDIQDDGVTVATNYGKGSLPWVHVNPNVAVTHKYRMRASVMSGGEGSTRLYSGWSAYSETVQLAAPPSAPTGLAPNGKPVEVGTIRFSWQHNPVDSSEQTAYELRYRVGAGAWTTVSGATDSFRDVTLAVADFEWQVRTKGVHPDWGVWSAVATVDVIDRPGVTILSPSSPVFNDAKVTVSWSFFQAQSRPQSSWRARLVLSGQTLETLSGSGATSTAVFKTRLEDATTYRVEVEAASSGVWSPTADFEFTTDFIPPVPALLLGQWDENEGAVQITTGVVETTPVPAVSYQVERSIDGIVWEPLLLSDDLDETTLFDFEALSNGETLYRATSVAGTGAVTVVEIQVWADSQKIWVNTGETMAEHFWLQYNNAHPTFRGGRNRTLHYFAGRSKPVAYAGKAVSRGVSFSGMSTPEQSADQIIEIIQGVYPVHQYRDPEGRRIVGVIESVETARALTSGWYEVQAELTEAEK